mmetsp:Transcript_12040/g.29481  ORF Transcript_12040/g.29481 Transcript_12040/m.29481 type:complete len:226 (-) Transcript_12040:384-1061(-)
MHEHIRLVSVPAPLLSPVSLCRRRLVARRYAWFHGFHFVLGGVCDALGGCAWRGRGYCYGDSVLGWLAALSFVWAVVEEIGSSDHHGARDGRRHVTIFGVVYRRLRWRRSIVLLASSWIRREILREPIGIVVDRLRLHVVAIRFGCIREIIVAVVHEGGVCYLCSDRRYFAHQPADCYAVTHVYACGERCQPVVAPRVGALYVVDRAAPLMGGVAAPLQHQQGIL